MYVFFRWRSPVGDWKVRRPQLGCADAFVFFNPSIEGMDKIVCLCWVTM